MKKIALLLFVSLSIHTINAKKLALANFTNVALHNTIKNNTHFSADEFACADFTTAIVYVDASATGINTGTSWANAFTDLQDAIQITEDCTTANTIYIAGGTYYPTSGTDRDIRFEITKDVNIYGGFSPANGAIDLATRNFTTYKTTISGNIGDTTLQTDNSENIIYIDSSGFSATTNQQVVIDGLIVTEGYNSRHGLFPGIYVQRHTTLQLRNCEVTNHFSVGGFLGGALSIDTENDVTIINSKFKNNTNLGGGGAIFIRIDSRLKIVNSVFDNNTASRGAGIHFEGISSNGVKLEVINSVFVNNNSTSSNSYGTINHDYIIGFNIDIKNSIFWNNTANGSTTTPEASIKTTPAVAHLLNISNSIFANSGGSSNWGSDFGTDGGGNLDTNPLFTDLANGDYTLKNTSPAIDTGDNSAVTEPKDLAGNTRIIDGDENTSVIVDMGAYEYRNPCLDFTTAIVYVDASATGTNKGTSWANAFTDLQDAIQITENCTIANTIYVAGGTYYPTSDTDRDIRFEITEDVNIYGGFSPANGAIDLATRNFTTYKTTISGNIGDTTLQTDNSKNIIYINGRSFGATTNQQVVIDGLTITEGYDSRHGLFPGIYVRPFTTLQLRNCEVTNHFSDGGLLGGALSIEANNDVTIINSKFKNNTNSDEGGAIFIRGINTLKIINSVFDDNTARTGAGIHLEGYYEKISLEVINSVFVNNISTSSNSYGTINHNFDTLFDIDIKNSILWNNTVNGSTTAPEASVTEFPHFSGQSLNISNSIIANSGGSSNWGSKFGTDGGGNLDSNPLFTDFANGDYTLQDTSPAIDAGINSAVTEAKDLAGNTRITDGNGDLSITVDMGAYETPRNPCLDFPNKVFVNASATGLNNGTSWANAYTNLQDALNNPLTCFNNEIWVAKGTYKPHLSDQAVYFSIPENVTIYGGFTGTETLVTERNWNMNPTFISGDLNNSNSSDAGDSHTIFYINKDNVVLDGLIIENSYAHGGLRFETDSGGGIYATGKGFIIKNSIFRNNTAQGLGAIKGSGGAFFKSSTGNLSIFNSVFYNNIATFTTGAVYASLGTLNIVNCTFTKNSGNRVGAILTFSTNATISNSIFYSNAGTTQDLKAEGTATVTVNNNSFGIGITTGITNGGGNFTFINPSFVDESNDDYRLKITSSLLNVGDDSKNTETKDLLGNPRKTGTIDIGAYEYDTEITEWLGNIDSNWDDANNWGNGIPSASKSAVFRGGIINEPNVTIANAEAKDVLLDTGVTLTVDADKSLTINRDFTNNGAFTILSDATSSGSFILGGRYSGTSNIDYKRYLTTDWHSISSPVNGQNINAFKDDVARSGNKYAIAPYNNALATNRHVYYTDNTGANDIDAAGFFTKGKGYSIKKLTAGTLTFSGTLHTDNVPFSIADNSAGVGNKWNLIGNPFTSFLSLNTDADATHNFLTLNTTKLNPARIAIYLWNASEGKYDILNHAIGSAKYIAPGQAFFVEAANSGATLTIDKVLQKHQTGNLFSKNANTTPTIKLSVSSDKKTNSTEIKYIENTTTGLDLGYDAGTFSENTNSLAIYTHLVAESNGTNFALQCLPNSDLENNIIPVGISVDANTEITISATSLHLPENIAVYLEDKQTNSFINLNDTNYTLNITENTNGVGRFFLHTTSSVLSTESNFTSENISIYTTDKNNVRVVGIQNGNAKLTLFDLVGKEILETNFVGKGVNDVQLPNLKAGVYLVLLQTEKVKKTKKIIIE